MTDITNHPITSRLHEMFQIKQSQIEPNNDNEAKQEYGSGVAEVFAREISAAGTGAAWKLSDIDSLNTSLNTSNLRAKTETIGRKLNSFFSKVVDLYRHDRLSRVIPDNYIFQAYLDNLTHAFRNVVALFMGLVVAVNDLTPLKKENFSQACIAIKGFMKDTAHMQMSLFFILLNTLGVTELPSDSYPIKDAMRHLIFNNKDITLTENFYQDINAKIQYDPDAHCYKGDAEFKFGNSTSKRTFSSDKPAHGCPSLFMPVQINGERVSLADASLNWIEQILQKFLFPTLE